MDYFMQTQKLPFYGRMAIVGGRLIFVFRGGEVIIAIGAIFLSVYFIK